jgi:hypothetical protein
MTDTTAPEIPMALTDLTPEWLSGVMGSEVTGVEMDPVGEGVGIVGQLARLRLTGADDLPASIIAKMH